MELLIPYHLLPITYPLKKWLPRMDLNHDKQIQSLLCYRYTTRQWKIFLSGGFPSCSL
jgi:hypothetical protein